MSIELVFVVACCTVITNISIPMEAFFANKTRTNPCMQERTCMNSNSICF